MRIGEIQQWIIQDQYDYGEWGKCEVIDPTSDHRNIEMSKMKPNIFTSSQAYYALKSTGYESNDFEKKFLDWIQNIRNDDGFWTSATGAKFPFGGNKGFSEVVNIRHTCKGLDLLMLCGLFRPEDANVFYQLIDFQNENGSFPQHTTGNPDIWSTAYAINLLIRAIEPKNLKLTLPRRKELIDWKVELENALEKALIWLLDQRNDSLLWIVEGRDPLWVSEAILIEIGAYLALKHVDVCKTIADKILSNETKINATLIWGLVLIHNALNPHQQKEVINQYKMLLEQDNELKETLEASCLCKLIIVNFNIELLHYFSYITGGHESLLLKNSAWESGSYFQWCIKNVASDISKLLVPINKYEAWENVIYLINAYKSQIENERGWELLWESKTKTRNENEAQVLFWNIMKPLFEKNNIIIREPETGRGPVDFLYINNYEIRILIEFKLSSHPALMDDFYKQVCEYQKGSNIDSAFIVIIGFSDDDEQIMTTVDEKIKLYMESLETVYLKSIFINAKRRRGASKSS